MAFMIWSTLGVIVYFLYSRRNSHLNQYDFEQSLKGHDAIVNASEEASEE
jgi:hypothetical protein